MQKTIRLQFEFVQENPQLKFSYNSWRNIIAFALSQFLCTIPDNKYATR